MELIAALRNLFHSHGAQLVEAVRDAERWRKHVELVQSSGIDGVLRMRLSFRTNGTVFEKETLLDRIDLSEFSLGLIGRKAMESFIEIQQHIHAARKNAP